MPTQNSSTLNQWLIHRAKLLHMSWPADVAERTGISPDALTCMANNGTLKGVGRSVRGYIARAVKISVRDLEALAAGRIGWIDDARQVDLDSLSAVAPMQSRTPIPSPVACTPARGIPIVGCIHSPTVVTSFDDWAGDDGPRLPIRYPGLPDAFALRSGQSAQAVLVFLPVRPGEIERGDSVLISHGQSDVITEFRETTSKTPQILSFGMKQIPLEFVHRAARVIGCEQTPQ